MGHSQQNNAPIAVPSTKRQKALSKYRRETGAEEENRKKKQRRRKGKAGISFVSKSNLSHR